jgi:hypothetical protein
MTAAPQQLPFICWSHLTWAAALRGDRRPAECAASTGLSVSRLEVLQQAES